VSGRVGVSEFLLFVLAAGALAVVARARGTGREFRLGVISAVSAAAAVYAVGSIRGDVDWYLTAYMSAIAVPLALGWMLFAIDVLPKWGSRVVIVGLVICCVAAVVAAIRAPLYDNRAFPNEQRYRNDTEAAWSLLAPRLDVMKGRTVVLGGDPRLVPTIAGVALKLANAGIGVQVTKPLVPTFGPERRAPSDRAADILITTRTPDGYEVVGQTTAKMLRLPVVVSLLRRTVQVSAVNRSP
jgi:lysylphosphatidylglycerol synthetase-like protein (DUF2156 family)